MKHTIKQGECILSISEEKGFLWKTIWEHGENTELRRLRKDPNVLAPGDELCIPDKEIKEASGATEQRHSFRKKGVPGKIKIRLLLDEEPRANERYVLDVDGLTVKQGMTDEGGFVEAFVPAGAQSGRITVGDHIRTDIYNLRFGTVDPIDTDEGIKGRLRNLGCDVNEDFEAAVGGFQKKEGLEVSGQVDDATRQKLKERFGQ